MKLDEVKNMYNFYTSRISPDSWAVSWEFSEWLWGYLTENPQHESALDLGSGWTSYLLRVHPHDLEVQSVDTDLDWAKKTSSFLDEFGRESTVLPWKDEAIQPADVVIYDCGSPDRAQHLDYVASLVTPLGVMVIDDVHRTYYAAQVLDWAKDSGWVVEPLALTRDGYGRMAALAWRQGLDAA